MGERRVNDVRTNTSDVVVELTRDRTGTSNVEANAQISIPIVDVLLPSCQRDHSMISQVNLSISGYEPDSLRTSSMRSPSRQAQEVSAIPQVDGPGSLPMRDHIERWMNGIPRPVEQDSSQGGFYEQRAPITQEEAAIVMVLGDHIEIRDSLIGEDILTEVEDPLAEEDTLM